MIHLLFLGETFWYDMFTFAHDVIITMFSMLLWQVTTYEFILFATVNLKINFANQNNKTKGYGLSKSCFLLFNELGGNCYICSFNSAYMYPFLYMMDSFDIVDKASFWF